MHTAIEIKEVLKEMEDDMPVMMEMTDGTLIPVKSLTMHDDDKAYHIVISPYTTQERANKGL